MKTIYKFAIDSTDFQRIKMPSGSSILCVDVVAEMVFIWAEVDTEAASSERVIHTVATGGPMPLVSERGPIRYIGTYQLHGGPLVFHVFEELE